MRTDWFCSPVWIVNSNVLLCFFFIFYHSYFAVFVCSICRSIKRLQHHFVNALLSTNQSKHKFSLCHLDEKLHALHTRSFEWYFFFLVFVLVFLLFRFHIPIKLLHIMPFEMVLHPVNKKQKKNWNLNVNTNRRKIFYILNIRNTYMARDVCCNRLEWNFCVWVRCLICYVFVYTIFVVRTLFLFYFFFHIFARACLSFYIYFFFIRIIWWTIRKWKLVCFDIHTTPIEIYWLCITYHSQKQHRHNKDDNFS